MSEPNTNPLAFLPEVGDAKEIPGGIVFCDSWTVNQNPFQIEGEVTFRFIVTPEAYQQARIEARKRIGKEPTT